MSEALNIIKDETLTYNQELLALAKLGENSDHTIRYSDDYYKAKEARALCDLGEGNMPYRPRYICPDYELLFEKGCKFLELDPPKDLLEAKISRCARLTVMTLFCCGTNSPPVLAAWHE